jgi:uncharacterized protein (TIGR03435 family)
MVVVVAAAVLALQGLHAQAPAPGSPLAFEVATIRPNPSIAGLSGFGVQRGGRFLATNATLKDLIRRAYGDHRMINQRIVGGPGWIGNDRFDVEAKAAAEFGPPPPQGGLPPDLQAMLQELLRERFRLEVHPETREQPIYALVRVNPTALGPKLVPSKEECYGPYTPREPGVTKPGCGLVANAGMLRMGASSMDDVATMLAFFPVIERPVHDDTGISGRFDFEMTFVPAFINDANGAVVANPQADSGPTLFTALQEQLGVKLEGRRGPVEVVVVDRAEKPGPN